MSQGLNFEAQICDGNENIAIDEFKSKNRNFLRYIDCIVVDYAKKGVPHHSNGYHRLTQNVACVVKQRAADCVIHITSYMSDDDADSLKKVIV